MRRRRAERTFLDVEETAVVIPVAVFERKRIERERARIEAAGQRIDNPKETNAS